MKRFTISIFVATLMAAFGLVACQQKMATPETQAAAQALAPATTGQAATPAVLYTCPMHPEVQQPTQGKCPKCGMDLVQKA